MGGRGPRSLGLPIRGEVQTSTRLQSALVNDSSRFEEGLDQPPLFPSLPKGYAACEGCRGVAFAVRPRSVFRTEREKTPRPLISRESVVPLQGGGAIQFDKDVKITKGEKITLTRRKKFC